MPCLNSGGPTLAEWTVWPGWSNLGHCYTVTWACVRGVDTGICHTLDTHAKHYFKVIKSRKRLAFPQEEQDDVEGKSV